MGSKQRKSRRCKACERCRTRKVKCDESWPQCSRCQKAGKICPGPVVGSIFIEMNPPMSTFDDKITQPSNKRARIPFLHKSTNGPDLEAPHDSKMYDAKSQTLVEILDQGRTDPFSTMARPATTREAFLLDYYVTGVISFHKAGAYASFHPPRDVCFATNIQSAACMDAMFAYTSGHLAKRSRGSDEEARKYWLSAIRGINLALSKPSERFLDPTIMAVLGSIHTLYELNDGWLLAQQQREVDMHIQGLRCLIRGRGGFVTLCKESTLSWLLAYTDIRTDGELSAGWTAISAHYRPSAAAWVIDLENESKTSNGPPFHPFRMLVGEYAGALRNFLHEARRRRRHRIVQGAEATSTQTTPFQMFQYGTLIYQLLGSPSSVVNIPRYVVLFLVHVMLWDYRNSSRSVIEGLISSIHTRLVQEGGRSVDQLLWILITDDRSHRIHCLERVFLLARLQRIHVQLSKVVQSQVEDALFYLLVPEAETCQDGCDWELCLSQILFALGA